MLSKSPINSEFAARLSAVDRVRRENRRNTPFGFSISFALHALFILLFSSLAVGLYFESRPHNEANNAHNIVVQTLVRQAQPAKARSMPRPVVMHPTVVQPVQLVKTRALASQAHASAARQAVAAKPPTQVARTYQLAFALRAAGHRAAHTRAVKQTGSKGAPKITTVTNGPTAASTAVAANSAPSSDSSTTSASTSDSSDYPVGRTGPVWSERPPTGPFGGGGGGAATGGVVIGGGNCTPSRGGFFFGHR